MRKSSTSAKSGTFSSEFKNRPIFAAVAPEVVQPASAPPATTTTTTPTSTNSGILFDLTTFDRNFDVDGDGFVHTIPAGGFGPPRPGLSVIRDGVYYRALCRAANRWSHFLSFTPEMVAVIRQTKPNWNGIELNKFLIDQTYGDFSETIASCSKEILFSDTSTNSGFQIKLNNKKTKTYTEYQLFHVLTHEFGHALGFSCPIVRGGSKELLPNIYKDVQKNNIYLTSEYFPNAYSAYSNKYSGIFRRNTEKAIAGNVFDWIPLSDAGHWSDEAFIYDVGLDLPDPTILDPRYIIFRGIFNDIMAPNYETFIDNYFISEITLGELSDVYSQINGATIYNYQRKTADSEVTSHSLTSQKDKIYFSGKFIDPPLNKGIKIEGEEEDKTWFKETIKHNCSECKIIYLDACGECS